MDVTPLVPLGKQIIQSYKTGTFRISNQIYNGPIMVFPDAVQPWTGLTGHVSDFEMLKAEKPDVILLGTGATQIFLKTELKNSLKEDGLFIETMDTGAACRTFNVLMAEGRRVAAALMPV